MKEEGIDEGAGLWRTRPERAQSDIVLQRMLDDIIRGPKSSRRGCFAWLCNIPEDVDRRTSSIERQGGSIEDNIEDKHQVSI